MSTPIETASVALIALFHHGRGGGTNWCTNCSTKPVFSSRASTGGMRAPFWRVCLCRHKSCSTDHSHNAKRPGAPTASWCGYGDAMVEDHVDALLGQAEDYAPKDWSEATQSRS